MRAGRGPRHCGSCRRRTAQVFRKGRRDRAARRASGIPDTDPERYAAAEAPPAGRPGTWPPAVTASSRAAAKLELEIRVQLGVSQPEPAAAFPSLEAAAPNGPGSGLTGTPGPGPDLNHHGMPVTLPGWPATPRRKGLTVLSGLELPGPGPGRLRLAANLGGPAGARQDSEPSSPGCSRHGDRDLPPPAGSKTPGDSVLDSLRPGNLKLPVRDSGLKTIRPYIRSRRRRARRG